MEDEEISSPRKHVRVTDFRHTGGNMIAPRQSTEARRIYHEGKELSMDRALLHEDVVCTPVDVQQKRNLDFNRKCQQ